MLESAAAETRPPGSVPCLGSGFVRLVDSMGGDAAIVQAARVSYGAGTKTAREDAALIDYLVRNQHTSPLEMVEFKFHVKAPLFVIAQLVRHRTMSFNFLSARYSEMADEFYLPAPEAIRGQGTTNKQVGGGDLGRERAAAASNLIAEESTGAFAIYEALLADEVAREQARMVLPQNLFTEGYLKVDLLNLQRYLVLRLDWHAQPEHREIAQAMLDLARPVAPRAFAAWEEHIRFGARFSRSELAALRRMLAGEEPGLPDKAAAELQAKLAR